MLKKRTGRLVSLASAFALVCTGMGVPDPADAAAKKPSVTKKITVNVGKTKTVKVTSKKKVKKTTWSLKKGGSKIVSLSKKKAKSVKVKGKKAGKTTLTAKIKIGKKTYKKSCKVTVKQAGGESTNVTPTPGTGQSATPTPGGGNPPATSTPGGSQDATPTPANTPRPKPTATPYHPPLEYKDGVLEVLKETGKNNPIASQRFMADPYAIEYEGRVYVYGTNDSQSMAIGEDGKIPGNQYSNITTLNCYSSADMVNWRDEGIIKVAGKKDSAVWKGPATWASNSWAPAVAYKKIDGKDKFFIYFADNGSGIGVLESDSPTGPWTDPIGKQLISRDTPNCEGEKVPWLFDPAVLVDDDGQGYLYFGGIGDLPDREHPKCIRVVKLGDDMISLKGEPQEIDAPAPFEDSGINKINGKYYYSYCTNWDNNKTKRPNTMDLGAAKIAYMVSDSPMGPWSEAKVVLDNPGSYFSNLPNNDKNNNHHCMFQRGDKLYMFYHSQKYAADMKITQGYRTSGVDLVQIDGNGDLKGKMSTAGVSQDGTFDPYQMVEAETFAWSEGTSTIAGPEQERRSNRVLSSIDKNDFVGLEGVDFGEDGAQSVMMSIAAATENKAEGTVSVYIDSIRSSNKVGEIAVSAEKDYKNMTAKLTQKVTGKHRVFFRFDMADILVDTWMFSKE